MKAHIYCRVSTKQSKSRDLQENECKKYCDDNGIVISKIYKHVQSSRNMKNKEYVQNIINNMEKGDVLIIHSICRFSRNMLGGLEILNELEKKGMKIYSVDDHVGYDDIFDRRKFRDIMNDAELETDKISHRVKKTKRYNSKRKFDAISKSSDLVDQSVEKYNSFKKHKPE